MERSRAIQDLNGLFYFAEVIDRGGFAAAGRALGIPKSRLSRRIAELEARLGVRLLQRTTRKLALTSVGEQFHRHCVAMREDAFAAVDAIDLLQAEPRGTVRAACPVALAQSTLAPLLPSFLDRYPQVRIDLRVSNRVVDPAEEGFDLAFRVRLSVEDSTNLVAKRLGGSQVVLVASPSLLERHGMPSAAEELDRLPTVGMSATDGRSRWTLLGPGSAEYGFHHRPRLIADDLVSLKLAVLGGVGVSLLPEDLCTNELREGALVRVLPDWAPPAGIVHVVYPPRRGRILAVQKFIDFLDHAFLGGSGSGRAAAADFAAR